MRESIARRGFVLAGMLLAVAVLAAGCDMPLYRATETVSDVFKSKSTPTIVVETFNGSIDVSNGADDEVVVEVTKRASGFNEDAARANLERVEVSISQNDDEVRVKAERHGHGIGECGAAVIIVVPPGSHLVLRSSNGYIVSEGIRGEIDAQTSNGKIDVVEASGKIQVGSSNGAILVEATDAEVDARTSNGSIRFNGSLAAGDSLLRTSNGNIDVRLPADSQFELEAATSNAKVNSEFSSDEGNRRGDRRRRHLSATIGEKPTFSLVLSTSNASINVRKLHE